MDAVVLANYANEHAPYAVRCLKRGLHVFSEVLPVATLKEAAELCDAVEESGKVYFYAENYCYFEAVREMRRLMQSGALGEFQYGEGEYLHDCEPGWASPLAQHDGRVLLLHAFLRPPPPRQRPAPRKGIRL